MYFSRGNYVQSSVEEKEEEEGRRGEEEKQKQSKANQMKEKENSMGVGVGSVWSSFHESFQRAQVNGASKSE